MAAVRHNIDAAEAKKFRDALTRLRSFVFREDEKTKTTLSLLLDESIAVDSSVYSFHSEYEGSETLGHLACQIPLHYDRLVAKMCHFIFNFCVQKNVVLTTPDLQVLLRFLTDGLQRCPEFIHVDLLSALFAVCEGNTHRIQKFHDTLVGGQGLLLQLTDDTTREEEVVVEAVRCLAVFTCIKPNNAECIEVRYLSASFDTLVHLLHRAPHLTKMSPSLRNKLLTHCFSGIQNIMMLKRLPNIELGTLFAAVRAYMFYGMTSQSVNIPAQLYPNVVTPFDPLASTKVTKSATGQRSSTTADSDEVWSERGGGKGGDAAIKNKGRNKKPRRKKGKGGGNEEEAGATGGQREERNDSLTSQRNGGTQKTGPASDIPSSYGAAWSDVTPETEAMSWEMTYLKLSSSDSEFSDTEGGRARQQKSESVRVRQCALNCFLNIVRSIDKKVMFGYWSSFLPDLAVHPSSSPPTQSLFTTILKDPSPKCRMAALASLTSMLESTKNFLSVAEDMSSHQPAFTPFSALLGAIIKEMHRCLLQALVAENFKAVLTQIIKCLASLVANVPYHRLHPGLLTRVLKQTRHFFAHKDPNLRTAALTCIGAIVGIKPPLMEVSQLIKPTQPPVGVTKSALSGDSALFRAEDAASLLYPSFLNQTGASLTADHQSQSTTAPSLPGGNSLLGNPPRCEGETNTLPNQVSDSSESTVVAGVGSDSRTGAAVSDLRQSLNREDVGCGDGKQLSSSEADAAGLMRDPFSSGEPMNLLSNSMPDGHRVRKTSSADSSEVVTPVLGTQSGSETPVLTDQMLQAHARETSWVIKLCMKNIIGQPECQRDGAPMKFEPLPIRLEALQVLTNLVKNYFPVIRHSLRLLQSVVQLCFEDPNHIIKLHGAKLLDELTQALQRDVQDAKLAPSQVVPTQQILDFWLFLLSGPLPQLLAVNPDLSTEGNNLVRSGACECMANIGEEIFAQLPRPRQMQCVTLVLGLAGDEDKLIRASAVRALGIYVMYPTLRDDVAFVIDAAKAILVCVASPGNTVRFKAAWAMANLCDSLVSNKDNNLEDFMSDFPKPLLLQLVQQTAASIRDSDKVSCNAARAIGNLLRYLPPDSFEQIQMIEAIDKAVKGLIKNMNSGTMKVRWNSCYAASNAFQNSHLPSDRPWVSDILSMLCRVVQTCTNFKVRINAALGLAAPPTRRGYGSCDTFSTVWLSLVTALETAENINDFAEYKYKDTLTEHICSAALHVLSTTEVADLSPLASAVHSKGHAFRSFMERYSSLLGSKKSVPGAATAEDVLAHLSSLQTQTTSEEQRRCLQALLQACSPDPDLSEERPSEVTSFQQIYD
ncbi:HEAT repeat-containing protein 6 [Aplysia californica]|uniref:HEAT repeat-containing protein 6 n=1 Tax=Aplysia californica TaxID=6500 RepID=A0ABM0JHS2_APLCA|nr:HEAT repeat-containing protein 6 [Aplysia californica]